MKLIPAIRGKIGSTEYYVATMKASEVVNSLRIPKDMPDWGHESIEDCGAEKRRDGNLF